MRDHQRHGTRYTTIQKRAYRENGDELPANGLAFSCRERAGKAFKKPMISCAKRSAAMPGWTARQFALDGCIYIAIEPRLGFMNPLSIWLLFRILQSYFFWRCTFLGIFLN